MVQRDWGQWASWAVHGSVHGCIGCIGWGCCYDDVGVFKCSVALPGFGGVGLVSLDLGIGGVLVYNEAEPLTINIGYEQITQEKHAKL